MKVAVILSGCGFLDGAEIRESVITLLALEQNNIKYEVFAPDINQYHVINHLTQQEKNETRNILEEAARIARGEISDIKLLDPDNFDALVIPGGFGIAKNFSNIAEKGSEAKAIKEITEIIKFFHNQKKHIVAICIAPALVSLALKDHAQIKVTLGDDTDDNRNLIESYGAIYNPTVQQEISVDTDNKIISCAAYMRESSLATIYREIYDAIEFLI